MDIEDKVFKILNEPIKGIGFKIIYIKQITKKSKNLQIIAERIIDQKLDINDCVKISKFATVLLENEDPSSVKGDVRDFKSDYQVIRYCFNEEEANGYPL